MQVEEVELDMVLQQVTMVELVVVEEEVVVMDLLLLHLELRIQEVVEVVGDVLQLLINLPVVQES
jgi:hypothetical protein